MKMEKEQARWIYKTMNEIRFFEEKVHKIFSDGQIPGFVHLYVGEEAVATGVMSQLTDDDYITSTHRGHGHAIAKGCDLNGMMAEIMGKRDGLGHGKGGSMHVAEIDKGMLGANGIVGGGFGLAIGAMFVRSMTIYLVEKGTLEAFIYLEHGAMYAIGMLAAIMLYTGTGGHVPEVVTGLIGVAFIIWAVLSSIAYEKRQSQS